MSGARIFDLADIDFISGAQLGTHDVPCVFCSGMKRGASRRRKVLRIWRMNPSFASYHCARCGESGYACDGTAARPDPAVLERARAEAAAREVTAKADRLRKARWLWSKRRPIAGSIAETYLRTARAYCGPLPGTLAFLPASGDYGPAMIAAFGTPQELEPGLLQVRDRDVVGVHVTRLAPDGFGKAGTDADKIMIGRSLGSPIVLAAPNDLLGMAITEGIEDGLAAFEATGLGVWAAGAAARMPPLAGAIPDYIEAITIYAHADDAGQDGARELAERLFADGLR
jgi:hypothetical protein